MAGQPNGPAARPPAGLAQAVAAGRVGQHARHGRGQRRYVAGRHQLAHPVLGVQLAKPAHVTQHQRRSQR